jgi:hypothetical protein
MTVPPVPVFFLPVGRQFAEVYMFVVVALAGPLVVENHLVVVPDVVIAIVGVIDPVYAGRADYARRQGASQDKGTEKTRLAVHLRIVLLWFRLLDYLNHPSRDRAGLYFVARIYTEVVYHRAGVAVTDRTGEMRQDLAPCLLNSGKSIATSSIFTAMS